MSNENTYWMTFWSPELLEKDDVRVYCYGIAVENKAISAVLLENVDGSRSYYRDKKLLKIAEEQLSIQPYNPKKKK